MSWPSIHSWLVQALFILWCTIYSYYIIVRLVRSWLKNMFNDPWVPGRCQCSSYVGPTFFHGVPFSNPRLGWGRTVRRLATPWSSLGLMDWSELEQETIKTWERYGSSPWKAEISASTIGISHDFSNISGNSNAMGIQWGGLPTIFKPTIYDVGLRIGHVPPICGNLLMEKWWSTITDSGVTLFSDKCIRYSLL